MRLKMIADQAFVVTDYVAGFIFVATAMPLLIYLVMDGMRKVVVDIWRLFLEMMLGGQDGIALAVITGCGCWTAFRSWQYRRIIKRKTERCSNDRKNHVI